MSKFRRAGGRRVEEKGASRRCDPLSLRLGVYSRLLSKGTKEMRVVGGERRRRSPLSLPREYPEETVGANRKLGENKKEIVNMGKESFNFSRTCTTLSK